MVDGELPARRVTAGLWTVVYIVPSEQLAESLRQVLAREGFMVTFRLANSRAEGTQVVEVLVPETEAEEANEIISRYLSVLP